MWLVSADACGRGTSYEFLRESAWEASTQAFGTSNGAQELPDTRVNVSIYQSVVWDIVH